MLGCGLFLLLFVWSVCLCVNVEAGMLVGDLSAVWTQACGGPELTLGILSDHSALYPLSFS